jgi:3-deoxy-D-manno-octulosonate 8-phosphate phosphatase KdsC-like HAD superfamily phosphatase
MIRRLGLDDREVAFMGDVIVDVPVLRRVGFAATVADGSMRLNVCVIMWPPKMVVREALERCVI